MSLIITSSSRRVVHPAISYIQLSGGIVTQDGDYDVHTFLNSGDLNVIKLGSGHLEATTYDLAALGAGGSGMWRGAGGGGGFIYLHQQVFTSAGIIPVSVGQGVAGQNGGDTIFDAHTAIGGGRGGSASNGPDRIGSDGGSGGGTATLLTGAYGGDGGLGTAGQGHQGGGSDHGPPYGGGGGGGAGNTGQTGTLGVNHGGNGLPCIITGQLIYYGGGGGGGTNGQIAGSGGNGGGGNGSSTGQGQQGIDGLGGGGGGSRNNTPIRGGNGILIIRVKARSL